MKKTVSFIIISITLAIFVSSCKTNKNLPENSAKSEDVWTKEIVSISGTISEVTQEKDGQTIKLYNDKGVKYDAIVSIPNLGENSDQYRNFKVGESVIFKGNLIEKQKMIVKEIVEPQ